MPMIAALLLTACLSCAGPVVTGAPSAAMPSPALVEAQVRVPSEFGGSPFDEPRRALIPTGWTISVWARVPGARLAVWAPDGALLVSRPGAGEVVRLVPGAGLPRSEVLVDGLNQPHGLAFPRGAAGDIAGDTLYIAQGDRVDAYRYAGGRIGAPRPVVTGLPDARSAELRGQYAHALKSVAVGPDGSVYYSVGSTGNISEADRTADPPRAVIMRVPPGGAPEVFASGVRNGTGLAVAPDGSVWTAVNHRDNVRYPFDRPYQGGGSALGEVIPRYVGDHPAEQLARLTPGRELGWPYCNPEPDLDPGAPDTGFRDGGLPFTRDVQTNADGAKLDCAALAPTERSFGAHSAPLGLSFGELPAPYGPGALVGVHGSWNRTPPRAPEVSFFAWRDGALGPQQTLIGGFQAPDGTRWGRPVAAVRGPDGAVYVTDDGAGAVYRLAPPAG